MVNLTHSSSTRHSLALGTASSSTTAIWIVGEQTSTPPSIDVYQASVRTMWYRFLLIIIIFVTAAGNVLVCLAIARERKLQNTTNYFLMSLAIADCLVSILVMPMGMISEIIGHFPLPYYACIIFATLDVLCCTSSIWHMSTMSMDRYFTIRFPFRYGRNKTRRIMLLKIVAVWAISAAVSSPVFVLGIVDRQNVLSNGICAANNASFKLYGSVFAFYIPFIIMITTYALTMRSLRNVLVNKRKYNRERRLKQTFRPLAQIINQYAEIAQSIRRRSDALHYANAVAGNNTNNNPNSILNKTPYAMIASTTTSPVDNRAQFFTANSSDMNLIQDANNPQYGSIKLASGTGMPNELIHHNNQHLTISYIKSSGSKKRRAQQQALAMNSAINRSKNECDMSTVYEITECSKSTSDSHDITYITGLSANRRSIVPIDELSPAEQSAAIIESLEPQQTSRNNTISVLEEEEDDNACSTTDVDDGTGEQEPTYMQIVPSSSTHSCSSIQMESTVVWKPSPPIIQMILYYYLWIFPYRTRPLALKPSLDTNESIKLHQSTSTSSINPIPIKRSRSISTQTHSVPPLDLTSMRLLSTNETDSSTEVKRRRFPFNHSLIPSSSLLTNFFRPSSRATPGDLRHHSDKSSLSLGQRSSPTSPSCPLRHQYPSHYHSSTVFRQIESEMDHILTNDTRPRASSSSTTLLHTTYCHGNQVSSHWHRPLRRRQRYQSRSTYILANPHPYNTRQHHTITSTTNTNSSDSSSVFHRFTPRVFSPISHAQHSSSQRMNDEHIVAANERKALRVLMIIFCVFVTLWTPFFICTFISAVCDRCRERISPTTWFSITWLGYISSMANPFIYTIFSDAFRRAFINIIFCRPSDSVFSRQFSTKSSRRKNAALAASQQMNLQFSYRRSPNQDYSGTSTPIQLQPLGPAGEPDGTIYTNRCASDSSR